MKTKKKALTLLPNDGSAPKIVSLFGILGALALVLSLFEGALFPELPFLPAGAKIGLSNIVTMFAASFSGLFGALYITALKALFAFITRGAVAGAMSLCGGVLSAFALCAALKFKNKGFSFVGIGVICAVFHNLGQLFCACVLSGAAMLGYGKYLLLFAIISGSLTGVVLNVVMPRLDTAGIRRRLSEKN